MSADLPHGLFILDTRALSRFELRINGHRVEPLAVDLGAPFFSRGHADGGQADADLVVTMQRHVGSGKRERLTVTNYGLDASPLIVEIFSRVPQFVVTRGSGSRG